MLQWAPWLAFTGHTIPQKSNSKLHSPDHIGFILSRTLTKTTNGDAEEAGTVDRSLRDKTGCHLTKQPNAPYEAADECVLPSSQIVSSLPLLWYFDNSGADLHYGTGLSGNQPKLLSNLGYVGSRERVCCMFCLLASMDVKRVDTLMPCLPFHRSSLLVERGRSMMVLTPHHCACRWEGANNSPGGRYIAKVLNGLLSGTLVFKSSGKGKSRLPRKWWKPVFCWDIGQRLVNMFVGIVMDNQWYSGSDRNYVKRHWKWNTHDK